MDKEVLMKRTEYEDTLKKLEIDLERARSKAKRSSHNDLVNLTGLN